MLYASVGREFDKLLQGIPVSFQRTQGFHGGLTGCVRRCFAAFSPGWHVLHLNVADRRLFFGWKNGVDGKVAAAQRFLLTYHWVISLHATL